MLWIPQFGPQLEAYLSEADVLGYGGAAGGGKSDLGVGKALTQFDVSAVFRREGTELTSLVDRIRNILGTDKGYSGKDRIWRLPSLGKQIEFGSTPNAGDEQKYKGRPKSLLHIDEADAFLESQVRFLMGWIRTVKKGQRTQALLTFNPPTTVDGRWIVRYFAPWLDKKHPNPAMPGELRWFAMVPDDTGRLVEKEVDGPEPIDIGEEFPAIPQSRTFIPARVSDNAYLFGTNYMTQLQALPEPMRSQMLYGDFEAGMTDDAFQLYPTAWIEEAMDRWKPLRPRPPMDSMGVDVARGGRDNSVYARRHGNWFDELIMEPGKESPDGPAVAGTVIRLRRQKAPVHIDVVGVGSSPYDFLSRDGVQTVGVVANAASTGTDLSGLLHFKNLRAELAWRLREELDPMRDTGIMLPPDNALLEELTAFRWEAPGKTIQISTRDEVIEAIGRSPDRATAVILANISTPRMEDLEAHRARGPSIAYDPYAYQRQGDTAPIPRDYDPYDPRRR